MPSSPLVVAGRKRWNYPSGWPPILLRHVACQTDLELIESDGRVSTVLDGVRVELVAVAQESISLMGCGQRWIAPALLAVVCRFGRWKKWSIFTVHLWNTHFQARLCDCHRFVSVAEGREPRSMRLLVAHAWSTPCRLPPTLHLAAINCRRADTLDTCRLVVGRLEPVWFFKGS